MTSLPFLTISSNHFLDFSPCSSKNSFPFLESLSSCSLAQSHASETIPTPAKNNFLTSSPKSLMFHNSL